MLISMHSILLFTNSFNDYYERFCALTYFFVCVVNAVEQIFPRSDTNTP